MKTVLQILNRVFKNNCDPVANQTGMICWLRIRGNNTENVIISFVAIIFLYFLHQLRFASTTKI